MIIGPQKIGIFSGTFDPVHNGHIAFAKSAIDEEGLSKVYFMVEKSPRRKQGVKAFEHRQAMVQLAVEDDPKLGSIITEQERFTPHETLPLLKNRFGDSQIVLLMGDDMLSHMHEWPHIDSLLRGVSFLIGVRHNKSKARERITVIEKARGLNFEHSFLPSIQKQTSSSLVRDQIRKNKETELVHKKVAEYIEREGLYSPADSAKN